MESLGTCHVSRPVDAPIADRAIDADTA